MNIASRKQRETLEEKRYREYEARLNAARAEGPYHSLGMELVATQSVCHLCSAVVQDRNVHTIWHAGMGQEMSD